MKLKKNQNIRKMEEPIEIRHEERKSVAIQWNLQEQIDNYWMWYIALSQTPSWKSFESDFIGAWSLPKLIINISIEKNMLNVTNSK